MYDTMLAVIHGTQTVKTIILPIFKQLRNFNPFLSRIRKPKQIFLLAYLIYFYFLHKTILIYQCQNLIIFVSFQETTEFKTIQQLQAPTPNDKSAEQITTPPNHRISSPSREAPLHLNSAKKGKEVRGEKLHFMLNSCNEAMLIRNGNVQYFQQLRLYKFQLK